MRVRLRLVNLLRHSSIHKGLKVAFIENNNFYEIRYLEKDIRQVGVLLGKSSCAQYLLPLIEETSF